MTVVAGCASTVEISVVMIAAAVATAKTMEYRDLICSSSTFW
jgi:hypothetical protein